MDSVGGKGVYMRTFGKIQLSNRDYERVVKRYIKFYKNESECSGRCPAGPMPTPGALNKRLRKELPVGCWCDALPMFPDDGCPCDGMGEKAFVALEKMVKKYGKEFM